jgi:hypothetical protein
MSKQLNILGKARLHLISVLVLCLAMASAQAVCAQATPAPSTSQAKAQDQSQGAAADQNTGQDKAKGETHITPEQAKQLFSLVDVLLKFSSDETGLPIKSEVKRRLTTREAVEKYLDEKFSEDKDAKRLEQNEIVLKKFGLLDRDFDLKPFLLALLKEQIEAYYDTKTKTVNLLDWVDVDEQKPVLAHELTHALQDQHIDLTTWDDQTPQDVSTNSADDTTHLAKDELDTAREAVVEGQATAVMMDNMLKPMGRSLLKDPEVVDYIKRQMQSSADSPVLARAPILLSESLMFPYREGLSFEQAVWMDQGQHAAFAGALDRPPSSSWEIINPLDYEKGLSPAVPLLPNIHPLVDKLYKPYDIGQVGQLDLHILAKVFGGDDAARDLTPAWDGGLYWAGQLRSATTPAEQDSTKSIALFYLSVWKNSLSAQSFAHLFANELGRQYSGLQHDKADEATAPTDQPPGTIEQIYSTDEGPVVITTRGKLVFVSESFPLPMARKITALILDAQGTGAMNMATIRRPMAPGVRPGMNPETKSDVNDSIGQPLSASFVRFFANCGVMKAAVDATVRAGHLSAIVH